VNGRAARLIVIGVVTGLAGAPPGPDLVLAAPPALYDALHDRLVALDATGGP